MSPDREASRRHPVLRAVGSTPAFRALVRRLPTPGATVTVGGATGSLSRGVVATLHEALPGRVIVVVLPGPQAAEAAEADLESLLGPDEAVLYPQREALPYESTELHREVGGLRVEAVEALFGGTARLLVTTVRALQERTPVPGHLASLRITVAVGDEPGPGKLVDSLRGRGFEQVPLVEEVGQFAVRGGILDVFSFGSADPVRIEFWGDEVVSIRTFEIFDQRSTGEIDEAHFLPVDLGAEAGDEPLVRRSLLELLPVDALVVRQADHGWDDEVARTWREVCQIHDELVEAGRDPEPAGELFLDPRTVKAGLAAFPTLLLGEEPRGDFVLEAGPPPTIERDMARLQIALREGAGMGHDTLILCDNDGQVHRLEEILGGRGVIPPRVSVGVGSLERGFVLADSTPPLRVLTDHEIFRRARRLRRGRRFRGAVALESVAQLTPGDYVVHMDHGIGRFQGLERIDVGGESLESLAIEYAGGEILRVPVYRLDLLERWVGSTEDAEPPAVHRIGGKRWRNLRARTEQAVEQMAAELLDVYARRELAEGFAFSPDSRWQKEMESSFLYEDTRDQRRAAEDVKRDMESRRPMDRLVCGDVGYGKTEVAIRAAFKAVQDGKQVAVLAPTTILVEQHRHTFDERLADYPVKVRAVSRFRTAKELKEILTGVASGEVDIVVGTHRLLSSDVVFRNLGLLVIDEEQRFGVRHKEKLKRLRASVDVLALTATPIPRTLQLSLAGLRNLSLIQTPPRDRVPVSTHLVPWSDHVVAEAIWRELDRGGQVFFLHNRVETIYNAAEGVRSLVPEARVGVAHGQMRPRELDEVMRDFVDGDVDVLVCSAIIENGLDVPNANTLIVDRADQFGLSQLYQIRGRVGRSDRRAYCYLITPDQMGEEAERRLRVLEHYTELGSGYAVALKDLELRGAGNLLGVDQSGFAQAVGMDTYLRLLRRAVRRLKEGVDPDEAEHPEPDVSLSGSAYLPDGYIPDSGQKLHLYRRLSKVTGQSEVDALARELEDRFGPLPPEAERLLDSHTLRLLGRGLGIERIFVKDRDARITFRPGVVPRLTALEAPFRDRQVAVEVRRMAPLSLRLHQDGAEPLTRTLIRALLLLVEGQARAA